jgi:transposase
VLFDNGKLAVIKRDAFGEVEQRWNKQLLALADTYAFTTKVCRPYRSKTEGKVEWFSRYLKESSVVPLAATLRSSRVKLDHIGR